MAAFDVLCATCGRRFWVDGETWRLLTREGAEEMPPIECNRYVKDYIEPARKLSEQS
jgi:hypothetical protein